MDTEKKDVKVAAPVAAPAAAPAPAAGHDEKERGLQPLRTEKQDPAAGDPFAGATVFLCLEGKTVREGLDEDPQGERPAHVQRRV